MVRRVPEMRLRTPARVLLGTSERHVNQVIVTAIRAKTLEPARSFRMAIRAHVQLVSQALNVKPSPVDRVPPTHVVMATARRQDPVTTAAVQVDGVVNSARR